ncbi:kinase-like domain-containing protein [Aspergillus multicolor]|uniref:kinase-like domain-containing protein n=1 Tax=Aspergillus multicolor TaxID=41759 RepID=UPI003CCE3052
MQLILSPAQIINSSLPLTITSHHHDFSKMSQLSKPIYKPLEFISYDEDQDYLVADKPDAEPTSRSSTFIYYNHNNSTPCPRTSRWWVKVTFRGYVYHQKVPIYQRRRDLERFVQSIDFRSVPFLDDTVTEVILESLAKTEGKRNRHHRGAVLRLRAIDGLDSSSPFALDAASLRYTTREDPGRVIYPSIDEFPSFEPIRDEDLVDRTKINDHVFQVRHVISNKSYILKTINRPFYETTDTETVRNELRNLELFRAVPNIVQAAGVAVSQNPYLTSSIAEPLGTSTLDIITGILLEFYPGPSLRTLNQQEDPLTKYPWAQWSRQLATALNHIHTARKAHMNIHPSNVLLDGDGSPVLIHMSGTGGFIPGWTAPELRGNIGEDKKIWFETKRLNDAWALGKLFLAITAFVDYSEVETVVSHVGRELMLGNRMRMRIPDAIKMLADGGIWTQ